MQKSIVTLTSVVLIAGLLNACSSTSKTDVKQALNNAISNSDRSAKEMARDVYRHPSETLAFFEVEPDMDVVEIWPGGGWYTNILAPLLKERGQLYAAHFYVDQDSPQYYVKSRNKFEQKVKDHAPYTNINVTSFAPDKDVSIAPTNSVDRVLTFRNVHNWYMRGDDAGVEGAFRAFYKALKPGGILGVVEHRMPESFDMQKHKKSGYMKQSYVIDMAKKAGFKLLAKSEVNANSKDNANHPRGVWSLPPRLALGDQDRAKYMAIGESDRMTLKFVKPE